MSPVARRVGSGVSVDWLAGDYAASVGVTTAVDGVVGYGTVATVVGSDEEQAATASTKAAMPINQNALLRKNVSNCATCAIART